ncbi:MAG: hypothetical protein LBT94_09020 [Prevotellaceae bacterium]|jgi:hypothetical protein|nr:hypothetical protein [Prevotellaceae bacterium]
MKRFLLPVLALTALSTPLSAQDDPLTKTVEVQRAYDPTLLDAYKISPIPRIDDTAKVNVKFSYPLRQVKPVANSYRLNPLPPARVQREQLDPSDDVRAYLRMGLGVKTSTLLDAYVGSERSKHFVWDVYANHHGSFGDVKNAAGEKVPTRDMRNEVGASAQYSFRRALLNGNAGFKQHAVRFYGYDVDTFRLADYKALPDNKVKQYFNRTYLNLEYESAGLPDSTWTCSALFSFYDYRSKSEQAEDALKLTLHATKALRPATTAGLTLNTDVYLRNERLAANSNTVVSVTPYAKERRDWWEGTAKLSFVFDNVSGSLKTYVYPSLGVTAFFVDNVFMPYVEISGRHHVNTYASLTAENPYLTPDTLLDIRSSRNLISFIGGVKGKLGSLFSYKLGVEYAIVNDMLFYLTSQDTTSLGNHFDVRYDDAGRFTFSGDLQFQPTRAWNFRYALRYDTYNMDKLAKPYNRPALDMRLSGAYNLWNKLNFYATFNVYGGYTALDFTGKEVKRSRGVDLNLGTSYSFFNSSSVFIQLNNVMASRYQVYNGYPTYGFNAMLGYTCTF